MPGGIAPPLSVIESWPKPNYVNPVTEGPAVVLIGTILGSISVLLVAARIYSRLFLTRAPGIDDVLILISLAFSIALTVLVIIGNKKYGFGRHAWDVPAPMFIPNRLNLWISEWCYIIATCSVKTSILLFYRRLSTSFHRGFYIATWIGIVYNITYCVIFLLMIGFSCRPIKAYWLQVDTVSQWAAKHKFTCINEHISLPMSAATSVLGDLYSTLLPCVLIFNLHVPKKQKVALYSLFMLGFFVVAAGIVRTYIVNYLINETYDSTWWVWKFWLWTLLELYLSIIAASAPALKPFFRRFLVDRIRSRRSVSSEYEREHKARMEAVRKAKRELWSIASSTVPLSAIDDVEKRDTAVGGDDTRKYELRTLPSGKVEPVQIDVGPEKKSVDLQTNSRASSLSPTEHGDWVLPTTGLSDNSCPLRGYRARIEALPPIPEPVRLSPVVGYTGGSRSATPSSPIRRENYHGQSTLTPRHSLQSTVRDGAERAASHDPADRSSMGSVKAARLRPESIGQEGATHRAEQHVANDPNDSVDDVACVGSEASTSDDALQLPRQHNVDRDCDCDCDSSIHNDRTVNLPRQDMSADEAFRTARVGLAV